MTKQKLLELCVKLRKKEITKAEILKLKDLNDKEIDIVLNVENKDILIKLLSHKNFKILSPQIRKQVIDIINKCEDKYGKSSHIVSVATNINSISTNLVVELATIISNAIGINQSYIASLVATNFNTISSGKVLEITKIISECLYEEQLNIAYHAAINLNIIKSGKVLNIIQSISYAKDKQEALDIYYKAVYSSLDIKPLDALSECKIQAIDFWQVFAEDGESALYILDNIEEQEELSKEIIITSDTLEKSKLKK